MILLKNFSKVTWLEGGTHENVDLT